MHLLVFVINCIHLINTRNTEYSPGKMMTSVKNTRNYMPERKLLLITEILKIYLLAFYRFSSLRETLLAGREILGYRHYLKQTISFFFFVSRGYLKLKIHIWKRMYINLRKINPRAGLRGGPEEQLTGAPSYKGF